MFKDDTVGSKVTLDVTRHPGLGHPDYVIVWVLIEWRNRVIGIAEIRGVVASPLAPMSSSAPLPQPLNFVNPTFQDILSRVERRDAGAARL